MSSQLTIPASDWPSQSYHCTVIHTPTNSRITKDIQPQVQQSPVAPVVKILHSSCNFQSPSANIELICQVSGFYPKEVTVEWLLGEQRGQVYAFTETPRKDENGYTFSTTSTVNVSQSDFMSGAAVTCEVVHQASGNRVRRTAKTCGAKDLCAPPCQPSEQMGATGYSQHQEAEVMMDAEDDAVSSSASLDEDWATTGPITPLPVIILSVEANQSYWEDDDEVESLWTTILIFFTLFLLSVCYSASVTMFKVKWLFSMMVQTKPQPSGPEYKNVVHHDV